jgi:hypothetical protein
MVREEVALALGNSGASGARSSSVQGMSRQPSSMASMRPAGPPPMIATSVWFMVCLQSTLTSRAGFEWAQS